MSSTGTSATWANGTRTSDDSRRVQSSVRERGRAMPVERWTHQPARRGIALRVQKDTGCLIADVGGYRVIEPDELVGLSGQAHGAASEGVRGR